MARHYGLKARTMEIKERWTLRDLLRVFVWNKLIDALKVILRLRVR